MKYNSKIKRRRSIRLQGYDYTRAGLYFVTICCQNRAHMFGHVVDGEMIINDAGHMIEKWYYELENKFDDIKCGEMITMPNHFHCIIENVGMNLRVDSNSTKTGSPTASPITPSLVRANLRVRPTANRIISPIANRTPSPTASVPPKHTNIEHIEKRDENGLRESSLTLGEHIGSPLHRVVQWFKTMSTNEYIRNVKSNGWQRFDGKLWQRNYWEHIIRNETSHSKITNYVKNNPQNWKKDALQE